MAHAGCISKTNGQYCRPSLGHPRENIRLGAPRGTRSFLRPPCRRLKDASGRSSRGRGSDRSDRLWREPCAGSSRQNSRLPAGTGMAFHRAPAEKQSPAGSPAFLLFPQRRQHRASRGREPHRGGNGPEGGRPSGGERLRRGYQARLHPRPTALGIPRLGQTPAPPHPRPHDHGALQRQSGRRATRLPRAARVAR